MHLLKDHFWSLQLEILLDKIAENQSWFQDKAQHCHQTEEIPEEVNALSTKMEN